MTTKTSDRSFKAALAGAIQSTPPIWLMRQAGRYLREYQLVRTQHANFIEFCFTPESAAEVTLQPIRRFDFDAAIVFADILLLPHVIGATVTFIPGEGPRLRPLTNPATVNALDWSAAAQGLAPVMDTLSRVRAGLPDGKSLIGFAGAPWTVATYMLGGGGGEEGRRSARAWAWAHPEAMRTLMVRLADATADYLIAQIHAGADAVKIFESWAEGLSPTAFDAWVIEPTKRIVQRIRDAGLTTPIIGFPKGAPEVAVHRFVNETKVTALALDMAMANKDFARSLPDGLPVQGGLDPAVLVAGGRQLVDEIDRLLDSFASHPYVFNLGHGIWPQTPIAHVEQLVRHVRERQSR